MRQLLDYKLPNFPEIPNYDRDRTGAMQTPPTLFAAKEHDRDFIGEDRPVHIPSRSYSVTDLCIRLRN